MLKSSFSSGKIEAGCDEAGRGPLAGPVVASAVILPEDYVNPFLNDSKKLTKKVFDKIDKNYDKIHVDFTKNAEYKKLKYD